MSYYIHVRNIYSRTTPVISTQKHCNVIVQKHNQSHKQYISGVANQVTGTHE